jgi:threonine 3-dehydrogenase
MRAVRKVQAAPGCVVLADVPEPEPGQGEIGIRVHAAGICGTDVHFVNWAPAMRRSGLPVTMGHEVAGEVISLGGGVTRLKVGDHVSLESHLPCGECIVCQRGRAHLCARTRYLGYDFDGGLATEVVVPERMAWRVSPELPYEIAAMLEPFGVVTQGVVARDGVTGKDVVVAGCGPIGVMAILAARALGAAHVIAIDLSETRLEFARKLGADECILTDRNDPAAAIASLRPWPGIDVYLDSTGSAASLHVGEQCVMPGGEIRLLAAPADGGRPDYDLWLHHGLTVQVLHGRRLNETWVTASELVSNGGVDLSPLIGGLYPMDDALEALGRAALGESMKLLVTPQS